MYLDTPQVVDGIKLSHVWFHRIHQFFFMLMNVERVTSAAEWFANFSPT